ncbi:MAG: hypothetical protein ACJ79S_15715 [Gemmatimonadaceae bacterium]
MAEIRVQQVKRRGLGWLWLLVVLVLLAIGAWYFLSGSSPRNSPATRTTPATGTSEGPRPRAAAGTSLLLASGDAGDGARRAA